MTVRILSLLALLACSLSAVKGHTAEPDANANWLQLKPLLFGERTVHAHATDVLQLYVSQRADDAAVVPVMVRTYINQKPERYIKHIYVIIDENPSPFGVKFTMTPKSGRADIETRVRMESSSPIRAIAEMNDGSLWMDSAMVFGAGGCSAPISGGPVDPSLGKMRLSMDNMLSNAGEPVPAQLMIRHPQITGMSTNVILEPHFVRQVNVYYSEQLVMSADVDFTISENPVFRFYFLPEGDGELRAEVVDSSELRFEQRIAVKTVK
ncbi:MAG TPA: quinoprotein dehydrogenase-associated SoxYZ-like carrier [Burkholderiales bacterium]|nr:quinoprotein dehydrogenase-associated SoxYZ-like carrier [Burkholderiales bacterium]